MTEEEFKRIQKIEQEIERRMIDKFIGQVNSISGIRYAGVIINKLDIFCETLIVDFNKKWNYKGEEL